MCTVVRVLLVGRELKLVTILNNVSREIRRSIKGGI
jgi:hypothetical protein